MDIVGLLIENSKNISHDGWAKKDSVLVREILNIHKVIEIN